MKTWKYGHAETYGTRNDATTPENVKKTRLERGTSRSDIETFKTYLGRLKCMENIKFWGNIIALYDTQKKNIYSKFNVQK